MARRRSASPSIVSGRRCLVAVLRRKSSHPASSPATSLVRSRSGTSGILRPLGTPSMLTRAVTRWGSAAVNCTITDPPLECPTIGRAPVVTESMTASASRRSASHE